MTRTLLAAVSALVFASGLPMGSQTRPRPQPGPDRRAAIAAIDALIAREMTARRIPGVAVAVVDNGTIAIQRAYGVSNLETDTLLTTSAVFELASVTKTFTATAIMMLVQEGKVRLEDLLSVYVDRAPAAWERITIRQLLTHTSGLDSPTVPRFQGSAPLTITTAQVFDFISQQPMRFPTGQNGWYSDAGYFLLGMVIEKASGQTYREFMQRRIFEPLGMRNSSVLDKARVLKGRVATYSLKGGVFVNWRRDWDHELPAFFGIFSTLEDVAAWDLGLRRETLLGPANLDAMWSPATLANGQRARVLDFYQGLGWRLSNVRGRRTVEHSGASGTQLLRFLDEPLTIVVLTNLDSSSGGRHAMLLAQSVAGIVRPEYRPPHDLAAEADAEPEITRAVLALVADVGAGRPSDVMSSTYRTWYDSAPGSRAWMRSQLGEATALRYLGRDELAGVSLWGGEPLVRLVHYAAQVKGRAIFISVGINKDGTVGTLDFYPM